MEEENMDWCTGIPEVVWGQDISECCKGHDETCEAKSFYKCLSSKIDVVTSGIITIGGTIGCAWNSIVSKLR